VASWTLAVGTIACSLFRVADCKTRRIFGNAIKQHDFCNERAEEENATGYQQWYIEHMYAFAPVAAYVGGWLQSFREFPPRMKPAASALTA
jgi:hypothetical protein